MLLAIAVAMWWMGSSPMAEPELPAAADAAHPSRKPISAPQPSAASPQVQDVETVPEEEPHTARAGHQRVAEELGLVATRCFVGPEYDGDNYVGGFLQRVENGWYSHVEARLEGSRKVEQRFEGPNGQPEFESRFIVSWSATKPGQTVPCQVGRMRFALAHVTVLDPSGEPAEGVTVYGCGGSGTSDPSGVVEFAVHAGQPCDLTAYLPGEVSRATASVPAFREGKVDRITIELETHDASDVQFELPTRPQSIATRPETEEEWDAEADLFEAWAAGAEGSEKALYEALVNHRRRMAELKHEQALAAEAREAMMERIRSGEHVSSEELEDLIPAWPPE
ncbi:MAG: hypothetical protein KTR31_17565 [Myxococcales bacterium]|nr:hypothetical protein [Myxococcales bacterium]